MNSVGSVSFNVQEADRFLAVSHIQNPLFPSHFGANVLYTLCFGFKLYVKGKIMSMALFHETRAERISVQIIHENILK